MIFGDPLMNVIQTPLLTAALFISGILTNLATHAQTAPSASDYTGYSSFLRAVYNGNLSTTRQMIESGQPLDETDNSKRTAVHIAAFQSHDEILELLVESGADINALEYMQYDVITIAAVANDIDIMKLALRLGGNPKNVTSLYEGTALIAAAHLGHAEVVRLLLEAGAPVDHVNNLGWTALIEAVILGNGDDRYVNTVKHLLTHNANPDIPDRQGRTPLDHARSLGYQQLVELLEGE